MKNEDFYGKGGQKATQRKIISSALSVLVICNLISCTPGKSRVPELVWTVPGQRVKQFDKVESKINEITMKKLGFKVKFEFFDRNDYNMRVNSKIELGENVDLSFTGYIDDYKAKVYDDRLMVLNELLEYTPKLKERIPEYFWRGSEINGKIYAVPHQQIAAASTAMVISKPLADMYGFDVSTVKSAKDIEPFLKKIKENETGIYPIRMNWGLNGISSLDSNEFYEGSYAGVYIKYDNGKITLPLVTEDKSKTEAAEMIYDWYQKGYIRQDIAIANDSASELAEGKYGVWFEQYKPGIENQRKILTGNDVYAVQISKPYISSGSVQSAMTGICKDSKYALEAIRLLELVNTEPEILNLITYGIENENYKKLSDGAIERIGSGYAYQAWIFGNQFLVYTDNEADKDLWEQTRTINESAIKSPLIGFTPETSGLAMEITKCNEIMGRYSAMNNGTENPKDYWEGLDKELRESGAETIRRELENQINKFFDK